jgi:hypothetical protein
MRDMTLIGFTILLLGALAASVLPVFADSTDPRPGYTYYVVYNQTTGFIVAAMGCPPSPADCTPFLQPGEAVLYVTDQPLVVQQLFVDAHNAKLGNWHVNLQTHQLENTGTTISGPIAPPAARTSLIGTLLPALALLGVATSGTFVLRRARRQVRHS